MRHSGTTVGRAGLEALAVSVRIGGRTLVDAVSLWLQPGEVMAVVGPNGAGKSTLLAALAGDLPPTWGEVLLDGRPVRRMRARDLARERAVLPQQSLVQFAFTGREIVMMGRHPHIGARGEREQDHAIVDRQMQRTETAVFAGRSFLTLSGGEGQRVMLARVLAQETPVLLLDEPTAALDIRHQELVARIAREAAAAGAGVMMVVHDLNLAAACAGRVALMHLGRLVALGSPGQVFIETRLTEVFEHPVAVVPHPLRTGPLIVPLPATTPSAAPRETMPIA